MSGSTSYHAGLAAEEAVVRHYAARGFDILERRWRGRGGEIDLIVSAVKTTVFVEVKTSASIDRALRALSHRQLSRMTEAAAEYLSTRPGGLDSLARFDLAAVDARGRVEIVENITA